MHNTQSHLFGAAGRFGMGGSCSIEGPWERGLHSVVREQLIEFGASLKQGIIQMDLLVIAYICRWW